MAGLIKLTLIFSTLLSLKAFSRETTLAGTEFGGGCGVMICEKNKQLPVTLLDFWEGRKLWNLNIKEDSKPSSFWKNFSLNGLFSSEKESHPEIVEKIQESLVKDLPQIDLLISKATENFHSMNSNSYLDQIVMKFYANFKKNSTERKSEFEYDIEFLKNKLAVSPPTDAFNRFTERGCKVDGLAYMIDKYHRIYIDPVNFQSLSIQVKAGLFFHELIYLYFRQTYQHQDSVGARFFTACSFSKEGCRELNPLDEVPKAGTGNVLRCSTKVPNEKNTSERSGFHEFFIYKSVDRSQVRLQFYTFNTQYVPNKSYVYLGQSLPRLLPEGKIHLFDFANIEQPFELTTRISDEPIRDLGVKFKFQISNKKDNPELLLDGKPVYCVLE